MIESVLTFGSVGRLVGIHTEGRGDPRPAKVVLANSGVVHRVGANRMSVRLARAFAGLGFDTLRFDMSGLGDSSERRDGLGWQQSAPLELVEAVDIHTRRQPLPTVLYGNCGGAAKSLWAALMDERIQGLLLTNPPPHPSEQEGGDAEKAAEEIVRDLRLLFDRGVRATFIFADGDEGQRYFYRRLADPLAGYLEEGALMISTVPYSNHTFAPGAAADRVIGLACAWLDRTFPRLAQPR